MTGVIEDLNLNFYPKDNIKFFHNTIIFWNNFIGPLDDKTLEFIRIKQIEIIDFGKNFNSSIDGLENCESILSIRLHYNFQQQINKWPPQLIRLYLGMDYSLRLNIWPNSLRFLDLANNLHMLPSLPACIEFLKIHNDSLNPYSSLIDLSYMPFNLLSLEIDCIGIEKLWDILTPNLKHIHIIKLFVNYKDEKLEKELLPNTLIDIEILRKIVKDPKNFKYQ